ncbi:MAG: PAS domain-containing protein [Acidobacteria bacterium]|nr:PAS domain-containing protein [Acidobacteriota bacterium]
MHDSVALEISVDPALARRVSVLIFARLALVVLIVMAGWWWIYSDARLSLSTLPTGLVVLLLVSVFLAAVFQVWLRVSRTLTWQIRAQFFLDTVVITWLVWETGDLISPYITFYILLISVAGYFLGKRDAYVVTAACCGAFCMLSIASYWSMIPTLSGGIASSRAVQIIAFNNAAFVLVGILTARIAEHHKVGAALKLAEANFADLSVLHERILRSINSGLITTDLDGRIHAFNSAAGRITGLRADDAIGREVFEIFDGSVRPTIEMCLREVQAGGRTPANFEAPIASAVMTDKPATVACSVSPLCGSSDIATGLIIAFQDTSVLHAMEETLRHSDRMAAVGRLSAGLAHEIRNPLGSMSSALQFLSEKEKPETAEAALMSVVLRESDRLNRIITDFLTYARTKPAGTHTSEQIEISAAIRDCLALLKHDPGVSEKHIFEYASPESPVILCADETQIKQVCWNLVQNAIHAMPDGGRLKVSLLEPNERLVRLVFADTGCGIAPKDRKRIFEPFYSGTKGSGLGLSIVHRIVTDLGGGIDVQSEVGSGTMITIDLPR